MAATRMDEATFTSITLSRFLDHMELSADHMTARVSKFRRLEVLANAVDYQPDQPTIITGSTMDGIWWRGYQSDLDTMILIPHVYVIDKQFPCENLKGFIFEICDEGVHTGYVRLRLKREDHEMADHMFSMTPGGVKAHCIEENSDYYLSSFKMKRCFMRFQHVHPQPPWVVQTAYHYALDWPDDDSVIEHGPSVCFDDKSKAEDPPSDAVPCFVFPEWPRQAAEWVTRERHWPPAEKVQEVVAEGIKVVAVGFITSPTRHVEWRLSFALTERELIRGFNNTQHKCYALMKMMLKEYLRKDDVEGVKQLNSYHMKNTMLWSIESSDPAVWCPERITEAFQICIDNLYSWLKSGFCPSYFIRNNNVFEGKVEGSDRELFEKRLEPYANRPDGWRILLQCKSMTVTNDFMKAFQQCKAADNPFLEIEEFPMPVKEDLWFNHDIALFPRFEQARVEILSNINGGDDTMLAVSQHYDLLNELEHRRPKHAYAGTMEPFIRAIESSLGSHLYSLSLLNDLSGTLEMLALARTYLERGMESDATAGKLKLANFHYMNGDHHQCMGLVDEILANDHLVTTCMHVPQLLPSRDQPSAAQEQNYKQYVKSSTELSPEERFRSAAAHAVVFMPSEINAAPEAVKQRLRRSLPEPFTYTYWLRWAVYDSIVYAHFLRYLCLADQNQTTLAQESLEKIEAVLSNGELVYEVSCLNLLAFTYFSLQRLDKAEDYFQRANGKDPFTDPAVSQLSLQLSTTTKPHPLKNRNL